MNRPAVSVIIPVYNPGEGIKKCIHMLRTQTLSNIEMLFVDDCGTDRSMEDVRSAAAADDRIRILINPGNLGAGASRNRGIEEAEGEYLAFVDPDDYPERDFLERLYNKAGLTKPDIVKGERSLIGADGKKINEGNRISLNTSIRFGLHLGGQIYELFSYNHWTAIYRRDFLIRNQIRYGLTGNSQDTTFLLRVGKAAQSISFEDRAVYNYVSRERSRMRDFTHERLQNELDAFQDQMKEMDTADPKQYSFYKYIIGKIQYLLRIHAVLYTQNKNEAEWFFDELRSMVLELPWTGQLTEINQTVRALVLYEANLSLLPYRAQGVDNGFAEWVSVVRRIGSFLKEHPEESKQYGWMLRSSCRNVLERVNDRAVSKEERLNVYRFLKDYLTELSESGLVNVGEGDLFTKLFFSTGINLIPVRQTIKDFGRKNCMNAIAAYFTRRDQNGRNKDAKKERE